MKIIIVGDIHADWYNLNKLIKNEKPDIILQVGDFGYWPKFNQYSLKYIKNENTKIYFCPGNHEDWNALDEIKDDNIEIAPNIFYMKKGTTFTLPDGRIILFMGGAYSVDKDCRIEGKTWFPQEIIYPEDIKNIKLNAAPDIIISHTCPEEFKMTGLQIFDKIHDPSRPLLSQLLKKYKPKEWYFGHWHEFNQGNYEGCKWMALNESRSSNWWIELK